MIFAFGHHSELILNALLQIVFEELGVQSFYSAPAPIFSLRRAANLYPNVPANQVCTVDTTCAQSLQFMSDDKCHSSCRLVLGWW